VKLLDHQPNNGTIKLPTRTVDLVLHQVADAFQHASPAKEPLSLDFE